MNILQNYLLLIAYLVPFFIAISIYFALVLRKNKSLAHKVLEYVFLVEALSMAVYIIKFFFAFSQASHPVLCYPNLLFGVIVAPVILIYFEALLCPSSLSVRQTIKDFLPGIIFIIITLILHATGNAPQPYFDRDQLFDELNKPANMVVLLMLITYVTQRLGYVVTILLMLNKYQKNIKHHFSYTSGIKLKWAYWALLAYTGFSFAPLLVTANENVEIWVQLLYVVLSTIFILTLFLAGYYQPVIYSNNDGICAKDTHHKSESSLAPDLRERLKKELLELFEVKKIYQNINLTIDDIVKEVNINRTYISKVINEEFGMNFYAFVNRYRLAEFASRMRESKDGDSFKIRETSEQVGFKSYTSFYNFFKEQMGATPSEYLKKNTTKN